MRVQAGLRLVASIQNIIIIIILTIIIIIIITIPIKIKITITLIIIIIIIMMMITIIITKHSQPTSRNSTAVTSMRRGGSRTGAACHREWNT